MQRLISSYVEKKGKDWNGIRREKKKARDLVLIRKLEKAEAKEKKKEEEERR